MPINNPTGDHFNPPSNLSQDYEEFNFGELTTDISDPEKVVNMYVYIVGEAILQDVINDIKQEMEA